MSGLSSQPLSVERAIAGEYDEPPQEYSDPSTSSEVISGVSIFISLGVSSKVDTPFRHSLPCPNELLLITFVLTVNGVALGLKVPLCGITGEFSHAIELINCNKLSLNRLVPREFRWTPSLRMWSLRMIFLLSIK